MRPALIEPLQRVLAWMVSLDDGTGALRCPKHGVEHTGKSAGAIVLACQLLRAGDPNAERLLAIALGQGRRLVARLEREGASTCFTFRPGRHDPHNCSNNVIDGGACSDALAELVETLGPRLTAEEREIFQHASVLHAQTYLRYAVLDKAVPAQRAWAMTGVAGAAHLCGHEVLGLAVREGAKGLALDQAADGSYPYHPLEHHPEHPGASDVSSFYQGRVTAFLIHSLERLGLDPCDSEYAGPIQTGLDFLAALYGPDGIKCGLVEAKPWYWGAPYEVASHPFDVFALARGWRLFGKASHGRAALAAHRAWTAHLREDGRPQDHRPDPRSRESYQCPLFWAAHASWAARALPDLEVLWDADLESAPLSPRVQAFEQASLYRLEDERLVAWVRGSRPGRSGMHGSPHGAGLVRVVSRTSGTDLLQRSMDGRPFGGPARGEWSGVAGVWNPLRGVRAGHSDLRFSWWLARSAWRSGRPRAAAGAPLRQFRDSVWTFASPRVSSSMDLAPQVEVLPTGVRLTSQLARPGGQPLEGSRLLRTFQVDGEGLVVEERLEDRGGARGISYGLPAAAREVEEATDRVRYRLQ